MTETLLIKYSISEFPVDTRRRYDVLRHCTTFCVYGVSTAVLNTTDNSRGWFKVNFGPSRGHVKSHHFPEKIDARRQCFYFFIQVYWNIWQETTWTNLLDYDLGLLFPFK